MSEIFLQVIRFFIPSLCNVLYRIFGFGYKNKKRLTVGLVFYTLYMLPFQFLLNGMLGDAIYLKLVSIFMLIANTITVLIISSDKFFKTLYLLLLTSNVAFLLSIFCNAIRLLLNWNSLHLILLLIPLCTATLLFSLKFCAKPLRFMVEQIKSDWIFMMLVPTFILTAGILITTYSPVHFGERALYFLIISALIEIALFIYTYNLYKSICQLYIFGKEQLHKKMLMLEIESYEKNI